MATATNKTVIPRNFKPLSRSALRWCQHNDIEVRRLGTLQKRWIAALESGKYTKARAHLCVVGSTGKEYHCCLGVACELIKGLEVESKNYRDTRQHVDGPHSPAPFRIKTYDGEEAGLPIEVESEFDFYNDSGVFDESWYDSFSDRDNWYDWNEKSEFKDCESLREVREYVKKFQEVTELGFDELVEMNDGRDIWMSHKRKNEKVVYTHKQIASFIRAYPQAVFQSTV